MHTAGINGYQDGREARGVAAAGVRARSAHARRHKGFLSHLSFYFSTSGILRTICVVSLIIFVLRINLSLSCRKIIGYLI